MRLALISLLSFCFSLSFAQRDSLFLDEYALSVNLSPGGKDPEKNIGFGAGIYHSYGVNKRWGFTMGGEFNWTSQQNDYVDEGDGTYSVDLTYKVAAIGVPFAWRLNFGDTAGSRFYIEAGGFLDLAVYVNREGVRNTCSSNSPTCINYNFSDNMVPPGFNFGPTAGIGFSKPLSKCDLVFKFDYKYGIQPWGGRNGEIVNRYLRLMAGIRI